MSFYKKYIRYDLICIVEYFSFLIFLLPRIRFFNYLKAKYLSIFFGAKIGRRPVFYPGVWIFTGKNLTLGDDVDLAKGVLLTTAGGLSIGDRVLVGYNTHILTSNHKVPQLPKNIFSSGHENRPVVIENDAWIGSSCVILPGVIIGSGSIVAAGSVVTKNIPENVYAAGVPARIVKERQ